MKISYTPEAIKDLKKLRAFTEVNNPLAARRVAKMILDGISQLKIFPLLGIEVEQAADPRKIRDLIIGHYIIRYLVQTNEIYILKIWHHKEDRILN